VFEQPGFQTHELIVIFLHGLSSFRSCHLCAFSQVTSHGGNVEKSRQRRSRPFAVLTYRRYAPRVKKAAALLDGLF